MIADPQSSESIQTTDLAIGNWAIVKSSRHCLERKRDNALKQQHQSNAASRLLHGLHDFFIPEPALLKYLKKSEFGSTTIISLRFLKLAR